MLPTFIPLPSVRRRATELARDFFARPQGQYSASLRQPGQTKAAYRFFEKSNGIALRFQIEVYHPTLESGCKIQERQLAASNESKAWALDLLVAWRIVHLTKLGR